MTDSSLLSIADLRVTFSTDEGRLTAVDGVSLRVERGKVLGIVGESGCGKSVTAHSILRILPTPPAKVESGRIEFEGRDLLPLPEKEMQSIRGGRIAMIFQEPMTSLNPVFTVGYQIAEQVMAHTDASKAEAWKRAEELLTLVGMPEPAKRLKEYPHQLSGGMRQRVMIAMAISCEPALIIADEPTTALDVTIQAQILELLNRIRRELGTSVILITHDLGIVAEMTDHVAVMYAGQVVEECDTAALYAKPLHPYTMGLMASLPSTHAAGRKERLTAIPGMVPRLINIPAGCRFADRCRYVIDDCRKAPVPLAEIDAGHSSRCIRAGEIARGTV
ncbi:MAG: ABC transporter ATP-binding protein [Nitrospirota bacterium]|nr:ABC transporter ATP-binding protein [Nitrospirota bacterium]